MAKDNEPISVRDLFLVALGNLSPNDFVEVNDFEDIFGDAYFESRKWTRAILGEAYDPHHEANAARHAYHLWSGEQPGFDMLRHEYALGARPITVIESVPFIHVTIAYSQTDQEKQVDPAERAGELASWLLQLPLQFEQEHGGAAQILTTAPKLGEDKVSHWRKRIDAIVDDARVQLIIYKRDPMLSPRRGPRNLTLWFDEDFRENPPRKSTE